MPTLRPFWQYTFSKLTLLVSSAVKSLGLGSDVNKPKPEDDIILASRDTAGVFKRLPDPHVDNELQLGPVQAKLGQTETAKWDVDAERGGLFDDRNNLLQ